MVRLIAQILYSLDLLIESLISIRFVFKLFNANPVNSIVHWVYNASDIFIRPFVGIVNADWHIGSFFIDVNALVALVVYMIIAFVLIEVIKAFTPAKTQK